MGLTNLIAFKWGSCSVYALQADGAQFQGYCAGTVSAKFERTRRQSLAVFFRDGKRHSIDMDASAEADWHLSQENVVSDHFKIERGGCFLRLWIRQQAVAVCGNLNIEPIAAWQKIDIRAEDDMPDVSRPC
jgi:hypothetical protein